MITYMFVTAAVGREVPIPSGEATAPGGVLLRCLPGKVYRVPYSTYVRKRIAAGDLLPCTRTGETNLAEHHDASAPNAVEHDDLGAVAKGA